MSRPKQPTLRRVATALSFRKISALYIFAVIFAVFSIWVPNTFLDANVWRAMLDIQSLNALVAIAVVVPLAAGVFDLAIGSEVGFAAIVVAWLLGKHGMGIGMSIVLSLLAGAAVGVGSALLIEVAKIDSFIATLGVSSVLIASTQWVSGSQQILNLPTSFQKIALTQFLGITMSVWIMLLVGVIVWYFLECTPIGRRAYAAGGNKESARLAGVNTALVTVVSLAACGMIAALAGVLQSARLNIGDPTVGPGFLLPAYAAAFLGSTQFRSGRYNVWGAVLSVYVLATGVKGLQLAGAPIWIPDLFNGIALLLAVGMAAREHAARRRRRKLPIPATTDPAHPPTGLGPPDPELAAPAPIGTGPAARHD